VTSAEAIGRQNALCAVAAAVIGGVSLFGGRGRRCREPMRAITGSGMMQE
jgi:ribose/xylose/arabinose/galactoside ABC-type transport system permease subunit